jgi:hypothetical protein
MKNNTCPECKCLLSSPRRCTCGWFLMEHQKSALSDHRCQYTFAERRCPLPGTMCAYPYGKGPWYCSAHYQVLDDPQLARAVLDDAEKNYHEIMKKKQDWRTKLFNK